MLKIKQKRRCATEFLDAVNMGFKPRDPGIYEKIFEGICFKTLLKNDFFFILSVLFEVILACHLSENLQISLFELITVQKLS